MHMHAAGLANYMCLHLPDQLMHCVLGNAIKLCTEASVSELLKKKQHMTIKIKCMNSFSSELQYKHIPQSNSIS